MNDNYNKHRYFDGRVIFDHLPKTAGQAINAWLTDEIGSGCITTNLISDHRLLIRRFGGDYSVLSGHVIFQGEGLDPRYQYITCFREPLDRAISWIFYVANHKSGLTDLGDFWREAVSLLESEGDVVGPLFSDSLANPYVEHFASIAGPKPETGEAKLNSAMAAIDKYDVWGLYEDMPGFMVDISTLLGLGRPGQLPRVNVTKTRAAVAEISPKLRRRLEDLSTLDIELYRSLHERWRRRQQQTEVSLPGMSRWTPYRRCLGNDSRFFTQCGRPDETALVATGQEGFLCYGPYIPIPAGNFVARLSLTINSALAGAWADVRGARGSQFFARTDIEPLPVGSTEVLVPFEMQKNCDDLEVRIWVPKGADLAFKSLLIEPADSGATKTAAASDQRRSFQEKERTAMTVSCKDCENLPKVFGAGSVISIGDQQVQLMHDGTRVIAGGYYGDWMQEVIGKLQGHHEPQEELLFHTLLKHAHPGSLMVEFGCYWAYYSNWYLGAVPQSTAICIEPDENRLQVGQQNFQINQREAAIHVAAAGGQYQSECPFVRESDGASVTIPVWDFAKLLEQVGTDCIEFLHMDTQGAELPFLQSIARTPYQNRIRFLVISTHHQSISGSATTHRDCLAELINLGAFILCEHSVDESFSGDGLIVASFLAEDACIAMPNISRNQPENSLFGPDPSRAVKPPAAQVNEIAMAIPLLALADRVHQVQTADGPMHIFAADSVIGAALKTRGNFCAGKIDEVLGFLQTSYALVPDFFVDVGANIGTHLLHALKSCGIPQGVAFEPDPHNFSLLAHNLAANNLQGKARLFRLALSSRSGASTFELCDSNYGDHRVRVAGVESGPDLGESQRRVISVLTDTGDQFFAENGLTLTAKTLMWVDTQGHEGHVFQGMRSLLSAPSKPFIVCEFWPYGLERAEGKELMFNFLNRCAVMYDINQPDWQHNPLAGILPLQQMYRTMLANTRAGHYPHTDLLCIL